MMYREIITGIYEGSSEQGYHPPGLDLGPDIRHPIAQSQHCSDCGGDLADAATVPYRRECGSCGQGFYPARMWEL